MNNLTEKWTKDTSEQVICSIAHFKILIVDNMLSSVVNKDIHNKTRTRWKCANIKCEGRGITSHCYWRPKL